MKTFFSTIFPLFCFRSQQRRAEQHLHSASMASNTVECAICRHDCGCNSWQSCRYMDSIGSQADEDGNELFYR